MSEALFKLLIALMQLWWEQWELMTPEQKAELCAANKKIFDKAGGMGSGVGE
jgi:hypothetical protein